jgi:hypothetical protein
LCGFVYRHAVSSLQSACFSNILTSHLFHSLHRDVVAGVLFVEEDVGGVYNDTAVQVWCEGSRGGAGSERQYYWR